MHVPIKGTQNRETVDFLLGFLLKTIFVITKMKYGDEAVILDILIEHCHVLGRAGNAARRVAAGKVAAKLYRWRIRIQPALSLKPSLRAIRKKGPNQRKVEGRRIHDPGDRR